MTTFSANLGFLWNDIPLAGAIRAAKRAGFDAVECHFPYAEPKDEIISALNDTGFEMLGINTFAGDSNGLAAISGREIEARAAIDQAIQYGSDIGVKHIHVMAGVAQGEDAHRCFVEHLQYAARRAGEFAIIIVIEPLNPRDAPGYFLNSTYQAEDLIRQIDVPNLKLMFDCYHVELIEGNVMQRFEELLPIIGHVQFASVPDRGPPSGGDVRELFEHIKSLGWSSPLGAEYRPNGYTEASLDWLTEFRRNEGPSQL